MGHQQTQMDIMQKDAGSVPSGQGNVKDIGAMAIQQLELQVNPQDIEDINQLKVILTQILAYPDSQLAECHKDANRLGNRDLEVKTEDMKKDEELTIQAVYCPCCSYMRQEDPIKLCHNIDDINNLGISTFLYFQTLKNLILIFIQMILIYSIYALATNVVASGKFQGCGTQYTYSHCSSNLDYLVISLGSKQKNQTEQNKTFYYIQAWIGVVMVIIWFITFFALKYFEKTKEIEVDGQTISASDFSIMMENVPEDFTQEELQQQLYQYQEKIHYQFKQTFRKPLTIRKFNKGKHFAVDDIKDEELTALNQQLKQMKEMFANWILERQESQAFGTTKEQRQFEYKKYKEIGDERLKHIQALGQKYHDKLHEEQTQRLTVVFVTLDTNHAKNMITQMNPSDYSSKIRNFLTCGAISYRLQLKHKQSSIDFRVQRAPQPEDIIWDNIGVSDWEKLKRKMITYTVTILMLGASFAAVYGLSTAQVNNANNRFLSTIISLLITLINFLISVVIRTLSIYEKNITTIKLQTSLALKAVFAQLMNSILVPIFANYFIKQNLYDKNGLADDIFMLGLTNGLVPPVIKFLGPDFFYTRFSLWMKDSPEKKLFLHQGQLNSYYAYIDFEIGYEYIYIVNMFLFTCFFVSLQPIISLFALVGFFGMYWAQKWSIFNRTKRPVPGNDLVNSAMGQLIFLGPLVYSLGSLTWSNFFPNGIPKEALIPNLIALGISVFFLIVPLSLILSCVFDENLQPELTYDVNRIYFPTEYDRINPATIQEGMQDYMQYVKAFSEKVKNASKEEQQKMAKQMQKNSRRGSSSPVMPFGQLSGLFGPPPQTNTHFLGQSILPGIMPNQQNPMNPSPMNPSPMGFQQGPPPMMNMQGLAPPPQQQQGFQPMMPQQQMFQQPSFRPPQQVGFQPQGFGFSQPQQQGFGFRPQYGGFQQPGMGPQQPFNPFANRRM